MAANASPIYSRIGAIGLNAGATLGTTIVSDYNGTGANNAKVFTADSNNGGFVQRLRFKALGANNAAVARIYINNGSINTSAANNSFYGEITLPVTAASSIAAQPDVDYPLNLALPAGYQIWVGIAAASALASGWAVTTIAGAY
jgi:hypothetical protein